MRDGVHAISLNDEDSEWLKNFAVRAERLRGLFALRDMGKITFKSIGEQTGITPTRAKQLYEKSGKEINSPGVRNALACLLSAGVLRVKL